jgi:hypothetical protein
MVKSKELCLRCTKENTYLGKYFCGEECEEWVKENGNFMDTGYVSRITNTNLITEIVPFIII